MKKTTQIFLLKIIIFAGLCIVVDKGLGGIISKIFFTAPYGVHTQYRNHMMRDTADIVIMGSSRAEDRYVPEVFEKTLGLTAVNCGRSGQGTIYTTGVLELITDRYIPKIVIMDIVPAMDYLDSGDMISHYTADLRPYYGLNARLDSILSIETKLERFKLQSTLYRHNSMIWTGLWALHPNAKVIDRHGWALPVSPLKGFVSWSKDLSMLVSDTKLKLLETTLRELKNKTNVFVVASPYYQMHDKNPKYDTLIKLCEDLDIPYIDLQTAPSLVDVEDYWRDGMHVTKAGAYAYSELIANEIDSIIRVDSLLIPQKQRR